MATAQRTALEQVKLNASGDIAPLPGGGSVAHYFVAPTVGPATVFRHVALDSALRLRHQRDLTLPGRSAQLLASGLNQRAAIYSFRRRQGDSVLTAVVDTAGQVLSLRREARASQAPRASQVLPLRSDSLFVLYEAARNRRQFQLRCLDLQQRERWQLTVRAHRGRTALTHFASDGRYVWLVSSDNARSRRIEQTVRCLDLQTGTVLSALPLDYQGERRVACQVLPTAAHSLTLVGRGYQRRRISRVSSGNLFVTRLTPDGAHQLDRSNQLAPTPGLLGARTPKTYWQALVAEPSGRLRLVGQTFTSTSWGGNFAISLASSLLTLGYVRISFTTLRPREIVNLQFDPTGSLSQARVLPIPERNSYTVGGFVPAQDMATLAARAGVFPVRGLTPDGRLAVLRTKSQLLLLDLDTQRQQLLRAADALGPTDVWSVRQNRVLLYRASSRSAHLVDLEEVAYDK